MPDAGPPYDIVIIGSGVCGGIAAFELAKAGRVLLLEAGETGPARVNLVGNYATSLTRGAPGSPYAGTAADQKAPGPETRRDYYHHIKDGHTDTLKSTYLRRTGGSTWHFLGNVPRFVPNDFKLKTMYGRGEDWPVTYNDLQDDYCEAERLLGVSGDHEQWDGLHGGQRSKPFPMPHVWESYSDRRIKPHVETIVHEDAQLKVLRTPQARNSRPFDDRPPCAGNSTCVPICPIQAKYDGTVHVRKAVRAGVELRERAVVIGLDADSVSGRITGVRYRDWEGVDHTVAARLVILAAHSVETAKILLLSRDNGRFANSSEMVGRNLMDHPQGAGACLSREPLFPFRGPPTTSGIDTLRDGPFRKRHAAFRMSLGNDGWGRIESPQAAVKKLAEGKLFGEELRNALQFRLTRQFRISYSTEMLPDPENCVTLSADRDDLGIPMPALRFKVPQYTKDAFRVARDVIGRIFAAMGGEEPTFLPAGDDYSGAGHIIGTCRMGADARTGVVNADGQSFDHPNLFIVGSTVFPTAGTANPTLTAVALTLRATRHVLNTLPQIP